MGKHRWKLIVSIILNVFGVVLMTYEPYIFKDIVDDVLMPMQFERLVPMLLKALGIGVLFVSVRYLVNVLAEQACIPLAVELEAAGARCFVVPRSLLEAVSDTRTPQGVCASFDLPAPLPLDQTPDRVVALDGVQDPGNVGTIWRTADAAGFHGLLLGAGCADPLSPKVQRSAMGSGFRLPFMQAGDLPAALGELRDRGWTVIASDLHGRDFYGHPTPATNSCWSSAARPTASRRPRGKPPICC